MESLLKAIAGRRAERVIREPERKDERENGAFRAALCPDTTTVPA
jgi:hypothetical protein